MQQAQKQVSKKLLNAALHATVEGCNSTMNLENHVNCINILLSNTDANINDEKLVKGKKTTVIMVAASKGFIELVKEIVNLEADVNHTDSDGWTALHYAVDAQAENADVVTLLIEHEAKVSAKTSYEGLTPLMLAVKRGHTNITRMLIEHDAELAAADVIKNNTALHLACELGRVEIVRMIATEDTYSQFCNLANKSGCTPIDIAESAAMAFTQ